MEIKIEDYLSAEDIKDICKDALYEKIREDTRRLNVYDIISNISYAEVFRLVDTVIGDDTRKLIAEKTAEVVSSMTQFCVFRDGDVFGRKKSVGQEILEEEVTRARPLIKERVEQIIREYDFPQLTRDEITYTIADVISDVLFDQRGGADNG